MKSFTANQLGRLHFIYLGKGEDLLINIREEVERLGIKSGIVVSGIGTFNKAIFHYIGTVEDKSTDIFKTVEGPMELACIQGLVLEGKPHLHIVFSEVDKTYAGHLEEGCIIQYLAEIAILEVMDLPVGRVAGDFGVPYMDYLK